MSDDYDPPWRLDPLQTIVDWHPKRKKKDPGKSKPDDRDTDPPGHCSGGVSYLSILGPGGTCYCPGVFGVTEGFLQRLCAQLTHGDLMGYVTRPDGTPPACASGTWVSYYICSVPGNCPGFPADWSPPPGFVPSSTL